MSGGFRSPVGEVGCGRWVWWVIALWALDGDSRMDYHEESHIGLPNTDTDGTTKQRH